jgi:hypothetical protein
MHGNPEAFFVSSTPLALFQICIQNRKHDSGKGITKLVFDVDDCSILESEDMIDDNMCTCIAWPSPAAVTGE